MPKLRRVAALAHQLKLRGGQLAIAVDSFEGVERLAQAMQLTNTVIDVFIELDIGHGRCGVASPGAAVQLAQLISRRSASLRYAKACTPTTARRSTCAAWTSAARP